MNNQNNHHSHSHDNNQNGIVHEHNNQNEHQHNHHHNHQQNEQYSEHKHQLQVKSAFINYAKDMRMSYDKIYNENKLNQYFTIIRNRKKQKMQKALKANQQFLNLIIQSTNYSNQQQQQQQQIIFQKQTLCHNISKIRTTVKQFFREWCAQSPQVKDYKYLVQIAKKYLKSNDKILVPGCGLGRLPLQLIQAGFASQGNQVTYFMLYGSNFILNSVQHKQQYEIYPFIHILTNHENQDDMFRSVKIPDKIAIQVVPQNADFSMAAGQFTQIYKQHPKSFQGIITCFFIDTANNIFQYIDTIYNIIKDNGIWINYGPLLYHYKDMLDQISIELSWQQIVSYIKLKGFVLLEEQKRSTTYCHDPLASYMHVYDIVMTVWKK